jgi:hypothetical protein
MPRDHLRPHHALFHFQIDMPVYVKGKTIQADGKFYKRGELFPWKELGMSPEKVANMFPRLVHHRIDLSGAPRAEGDGPPRTGEPYVVPDQSAEHLMQSKALSDMTIREMRIVAKHVGCPTKRTRGEQLDALLEHLEQETA